MPHVTMKDLYESQQLNAKLIEVIDGWKELYNKSEAKACALTKAHAKRIQDLTEAHKQETKQVTEQEYERIVRGLAAEFNSGLEHEIVLALYDNLDDIGDYRYEDFVNTVGALMRAVQNRLQVSMYRLGEAAAQHGDVIFDPVDDDC